MACHTSYITTITITDVLYITKKTFSDSTLQKNKLADFFSDFKICKTTQKQIYQAFKSQMKDFEDAVQAFSAKASGVKLIVTRNTKDFNYSPIKAVTPEEFLNIA